MEDWLVMVTWLLAAVAGGADEDPECLVLGGLDAVRTAAVTSARPGLLLDVYAEERAAVRDARGLESYAERGLAVHGATLHRHACRVSARGAEEVRLDVVDRLGPTWVEDAHGRTRALPQDRPSRREITLRLTPDGWRIAATG